jgi:hypothetical protein
MHLIFQKIGFLLGSVDGTIQLIYDPSNIIKWNKQNFHGRDFPNMNFISKIAATNKIKRVLIIMD